MLGATFLTFMLMQLAPGDPAEQIALARYGMDNLTEEMIAEIRAEENLDAPVLVQYGTWLSHVLQGDLGRSLTSGVSVTDEIWKRFPATLELALAAMFISLIISIPIGVISAVKRYSVFDHMSMGGALVGVSMPNFWLALLLIMLFSVTLGWFPVFGRGGIQHLVLPAVTLGTGMIAINARLMRSGMLEVLGQNYIRTARAKGLTERAVNWKHALRNALVPVVTVAGLQLAYLLEGSVVVETIFAWPGIGRLLVESIYSQDYAVIQGCTLAIAAVFVITNLLVDISYAFLDPRIRYEKRALA